MFLYAFGVCNVHFSIFWTRKIRLMVLIILNQICISTININSFMPEGKQIFWWSKTYLNNKKLINQNGQKVWPKNGIKKLLNAKPNKASEHYRREILLNVWSIPKCFNSKFQYVCLCQYFDTSSHRHFSEQQKYRPTGHDHIVEE